MTHLLQRVVFPVDRDPDLLPLYADPETWSTIDDTPVRVSSRAHLKNILSRDSARITAGRRVSFGSYFNAFPASYWQHWTPVRDVTLTVQTRGTCTVLLYRSNGSGVVQRLETRQGTETTVHVFDVALDQYSDGGWIWFDIVADDSDAILERAEWTTSCEPARSGNASIGITTFNKPDYCIRTLQSLADDADAIAVIDRVFVIDQGTQRVADEPQFLDVSDALGDVLQVIHQANLGGSGGFARAMAETLGRGESDFVQLLDDDVRIETESLRRSVVFGRFCSVPTIVGAHMFDLLDRPKLHAWAEVVDEGPFMWRNLHQEVMPHDFARSNLRQSPILHQRLDSDYNGWWMCLIPTEVIRDIGLPLPAFIKWDDAEHCLRARSSGYPTVSVPGVALWHVSWVGKDDSIDWQAYFHARNRIVAALLHSTAPDGGLLLRHSRRVDLKHLMMMQYYPVALRHKAIRDILSGPQHMRASLASAMPEARALAADFGETTIHKDTGIPIRSLRGRQVFAWINGGRAVQPSGLRLRAFTFVTLIAHWLHTPRPENLRHAEVEFSKHDANWWRLPKYDSVMVSAADGSGKNIYTRDRAMYRSMLWDSIRLHRSLRRHWTRLSHEYRGAAADLTSLESWRDSFTASEGTGA